MAWIKDFSKLEKKEQLPDLSGVAVDMHSHLIPGIDDGAKTIEDSLMLIRRLQKLGYKKLIITPHININFPNSPETIHEGLLKVQEAVRKENIPVEIDAAAEYYLDDNFENLFKQGNLLTFGNNHILLELSYYIPNPSFSKVIYDLQMAGYKVILAHVERYSFWHKNLEEFEKLKARDLLLQINFMSLNIFNPLPIRKTAQMLIDAGMVDFAGTDVHNDLYMKLMLFGMRSKYGQKLIASGMLKNPMLL
jgi:tyrosine-protein phosphatase YwqE